MLARVGRECGLCTLGLRGQAPSAPGGPRGLPREAVDTDLRPCPTRTAHAQGRWDGSGHQWPRGCLWGGPGQL